MSVQSTFSRGTLCKVPSIVVAAVLAAGCATQQETLLSQGYPAAYAAGFEDGCHSGKKAGGSYFEQFHKDVPRFNSDKDYAQGWSDAYRHCETQAEAFERRVRTAETISAIHRDHDDDFARRVLDGLDTSGLENLKP